MIRPMDFELKEPDERIVQLSLGAAISVHKALGPGLLESTYENAMMIELADREIGAKRQVEIPAMYKGRDLGVGYRADIIVADCLLLELKTVEALSALHIAQLITYLRLLRFKRGYLLNFNCKTMAKGIKRISI